MFIPSREQFRMARYGLDLNLLDAAQGAGVNPNTITHMETGKTKEPKLLPLVKIKEFYEAQGGEFGVDGWVRITKATS
jgi:DNA-binding XRE family transcriptional regulator